MVGDLGRAQPVTPVIDRGLQGAERLVLVRRRPGISPGQGDERRLSLGEGRAAVTAGAQHAERDTARQAELRVPFRGDNRHRVVPLARIAPGAADGPVVEERPAVHHGLDLAADAGRDPHQRPDGAEISGGPMVVGPASLVRDRADGQEVLDDHPPRRGLPGCFQHHRPRHVPAVLRDVGGARTEPEHAGGPVEQRPEHTGGIGPRQAQPFD